MFDFSGYCQFPRLLSTFSMWNWKKRNAVFGVGSLEDLYPEQAIVSGLCIVPWLKFALRDYELWPKCCFLTAIRMTYYSKTLEGYTPVVSQFFSLNFYFCWHPCMAEKPYCIFFIHSLCQTRNELQLQKLSSLGWDVCWSNLFGKVAKKQTDPISRIKRIERIWIFLGERTKASVIKWWQIIKNPDVSKSRSIRDLLHEAVGWPEIQEWSWTTLKNCEKANNLFNTIRHFGNDLFIIYYVMLLLHQEPFGCVVFAFNTKSTFFGVGVSNLGQRLHLDVFQN